MRVEVVGGEKGFFGGRSGVGSSAMGGGEGKGGGGGTIAPTCQGWQAE